MSRVLMGLLLGGANLLACDLNRQPTQYRIHIHCQLADGKPVAGVQIARSLQGSPVGASDAQGNLVLALEGKREGEEVEFAIAGVPPTLVLTEADKVRHVILKNYGDLSQRTSDVKYEIRLRPKKEMYVVLVRAEQAPMLPISANGAEVAHLNSRSAAAFRTEGKPGDELKVTILASRGAKVKGADPTQSFLLPEGGGILSFHSSLFLKPEVVKRVATPKQSVVIKWGKL